MSEPLWPDARIKSVVEMVSFEDDSIDGSWVYADEAEGQLKRMRSEYEKRIVDELTAANATINQEYLNLLAKREGE
jgi:uncharacterized protein YeeX (DUF496 family)